MSLNINQTPASTCPICGENLNAATQVNNEAVKPEPGDVSVCFVCGEISIFGPDLKLTAAKESDLAVGP